VSVRLAPAYPAIGICECLFPIEFKDQHSSTLQTSLCIRTSRCTPLPQLPAFSVCAPRPGVPNLRMRSCTLKPMLHRLPHLFPRRLLLRHGLDPLQLQRRPLSWLQPRLAGRARHMRTFMTKSSPKASWRRQRQWPSSYGPERDRRQSRKLRHPHPLPLRPPLAMRLLPLVVPRCLAARVPAPSARGQRSRFRPRRQRSTPPHAFRQRLPSGCLP
jgi:hypothetical protein